MKRDLRSVGSFGIVLALIGVLLLSTAAFAHGPSQAGQEQAQLRSQNGNTHGEGDGTGPIGGGEFGSGPKYAGGATAVQAAYGPGPGDGTGPVGGGFGPGPKGECLDTDDDGVCDCRE